jgi:hypothetical protein
MITTARLAFYVCTGLGYVCGACIYENEILGQLYLLLVVSSGPSEMGTSRTALSTAIPRSSSGPLEFWNWSAYATYEKKGGKRVKREHTSKPIQDE